MGSTQFFKEIINWDNQTKEKVEIISDKKLAKKELSDSNLPYDVPRPFNIVLAKKNYIKQIDILINLFDKFSIEYEEKVKDKEDQKDENGIEFNDTLFLRIIFYMAEFYNQINIQKMELKPCFHNIILKFIKYLKRKDKIIPFIIHKNIPDSPELGQYLLELSMNNDINSKEYENLGLKILGKLKKYEIIIDYLFSKGKIVRGLNYMSDIFIQLNEQQINNIFEKNKNVIQNNKDLFLNYLK